MHTCIIKKHAFMYPGIHLFDNSALYLFCLYSRRMTLTKRAAAKGLELPELKFRYRKEDKKCTWGNKSFCT